MQTLRSKILACFLALSLVLLTTPVSLNFDTHNKSIEIQPNQAHAVLPIGAAAAAFLADIAAASGLTVSELVTTVVGMTAVSTGMGIAREAGINYGNAASVNLGNLIDAADYPAWDTLSEEQQESWGSKENYDSAKFNSLLDAFDLGDARDRFYSSDGGNVDYTSDELTRLEQLGSIGQNWIKNGSNTVQNIIDSMNPQYQNVFQNFIGRSTYKKITGADYDNWPSGAPDELYINVGNYCMIKSGPDASNRYIYMQTQSTADVYYIVMYRNYGNGRYASKNIYMFSKSGFKFGSNTKTIAADKPVVLDPVSATTDSREMNGTGDYSGKFYYNGGYVSEGGSSDYVESTMMANQFTGTNLSWVNQVEQIILFSEDATAGLGSATPDIVGYPEDILTQGDTNIYFPSTGIVPGTNWQDYETQPETPPIIDEEVDLTEIIELLKRFHFTVDYNLLVQDNPLRSAVREIASSLDRFNFYSQYGELKVHDQRLQDALSLLLGKFQFYSTGQLKVHDEGVYDAIGDMSRTLGGLLNQIQATLSGFFVTDTATDVIGDLNFPDLGDKAVDLVDTISTLAPFGAMFLISELVAILSQVGKIQSPSMVFDFNFMPGQEYGLTVDLSWLDDAKPIINLACIVTLIVALAGATARLIELEAAA